MVSGQKVRAKDQDTNDITYGQNRLLGLYLDPAVLIVRENCRVDTLRFVHPAILIVPEVERFLKEGGLMPIFFYLAFVVAIFIAIFAVQNSNAAPVLIRFLVWKFETSLVYALLGSVCSGILVTLLFWLQRSIRLSREMKQSATPEQGEEKKE